MNQHLIAWWNLENLFAVEGSPDCPLYFGMRNQ